MKGWSFVKESLLHLMFPHICSGCGTDAVRYDRSLCFRCVSRLPLTGFAPLAGNPIERKFYGRLPLQSAFSLLYFTPDSLVQELMHAIKYRGDRELAIELGRMLGQSMLDAPRLEPGTLIPLPLFASKEKKRGYNQATLLCEGIAEVTGWCLQKNLVKRSRHTESQTRKSRIERWMNMEGNFEISNTDGVIPGHYWLIDDVLTTGATLEACGQALLTLPGASLSIATMGYAWR